MRIAPKQTLTRIIPIILIPDWSQTNAPLGDSFYQSVTAVASNRRTEALASVISFTIVLNT